MFINTKSHCIAVYTDKGKQRHFHRWIAIALTPDESEKLKSEPFLSGDIEDATCCGGVNERDLCMFT